MKITIAERFKPFSHVPGTMAILPGSYCYVRAYPTLIELMYQTEKISIPVGLTGPVADFTFELDLEKNCIFVFGRAKEGFYRFRIRAEEKGVEVLGEKIPGAGLIVHGAKFLRGGRLFFPIEYLFSLPQNMERLFLGSTKKQDWTSVISSFDLNTFVPILYTLGQKCPLIARGKMRGSATLIEKGELEPFCRAAFKELLVPRLFDDQHQGLCPQEGKEEDPSFLLKESKDWIRSFFIEQHGNRVKLLPKPMSASGRMTDIEISLVGTLDFEWRGKTVRRAKIVVEKSASILLELTKPLISFRIRVGKSSKSKRHFAKDLLELEEGKTYLLDRFYGESK